MEDLNQKPKQEQVPSEQTKNVREVFGLHPELGLVGSPEEYEKYLETIFPESKMKSIVWHNSPKPVTEFEKQDDGLEEFFFSGGKDTIWKILATMGESEVFQTPVLLNIQKPKIEEFDEDDHEGQSYRMRFAQQEGYDGVLVENKKHPEDSERVVFANEQVYILGSKSDIEKFREFVANEQK